jgi:PAS domain S-box-containing protein
MPQKRQKTVNRPKGGTGEFEEVPPPVMITDGDGFVVYLNETAERATGYHVSEALGLPLSRFFPDEDAGECDRIIRELSGTSPVFVPRVSLSRKDGTGLVTTLSAYPLAGREGSPRYSLFILKDPFAGARPKGEIRLVERAVDTVREGVVITDLEGMIIYSNRTISKMFGYDEGQYVGRNVSGLFALQAAENLTYDILSNTLDGSWEREINAIRRDGSRFNARLSTALFFQEEKRPAHIVCTIQDITKEVEMREEWLSANRELSALYAVSTALAESIELDELLYNSLEKVLEVMGMDAGIVRLIDEAAEDLVVRTHVGVSDAYLSRYRRMPLEGSISGKVVKTGVPNLSSKDNPEQVEEQALLMTEGFYQAIVVPIRSKDKTLGTLSAGVFARRTSITQDMKLLVSIGSLIGVAVENAMIFERADLLSREKDLKVGELSLLTDLSGALMTTIELDRLLYIVLTAATFGETFGFNRAALFLVDEERQTLVGRMGVGPTSAEEAGRIWADLEDQKPSLFEIVRKDFERHGSADTIQNRALRRITIPLNRTDDLVVRSVLENRPIIVSDARTNPHVNDVMRRALEGGGEFACVPIVALDRPLGALLVDNVFNRKPIKEEDIGLLVAFANQAGLAIQNSILYTNKERVNRELREAQAKLLQQAKLVGLGEMASEMAHEIRNPLVSIGGFARKISEAAADDSKLRRYSDIVVKEVKALEHTLSNILSFPRDIPPRIASVDFNGVVKDTLGLVVDDLTARKITLAQHLDEYLPEIEADPEQLRQVFLNLFFNAVQAMEQGGTLTVRTSREDIGGNAYVRAEVSDTGPGVSSDVMGNIFKPFFTTKRSGMGLGLAITHRIVTAHGGNIDIVNPPEGGATFIVELPVKQPDQENRTEQAP